MPSYDVEAFQIQGSFTPASAFPGGVGQLVTTILTILMSTAGALGLIFIIMAGIKFVTSSGDPKKTASAQQTLTYAIIGLAVATLAFIIVQIVQTIFRANIPVT